MKEYLERVTSFVVVLLFIVSAAAWSGKLLGFDLVPKAKEENNIVVKTPNENEQVELGIKGIDLKQKDLGIWTLQDERGDSYTLIDTSCFASDIKGYGGNIPLFILLDIDNKIKKIVISEENFETVDFVEEIKRSNILQSWKGKTIDEGLGIRPDAVSGATFTSKAVIESVNKTLSSIKGNDFVKKQEPIIGWFKTIALLLVLVFGIWVAFLKSSNRILRMILLSLNVLIVGLWCGELISLNLMINYVSRGVNIISVLPTFIILLIAFLFPLIFNKKSYYCTWICPFGSAQELLGKLCKKKLHIGEKLMSRLKYVRDSILMLLFFFIWIDIGFSLADYEPFSVFNLSQSTSSIILILSTLVLLFSFFVNRPWCRFVCPTGALLSWSEKIK